MGMGRKIIVATALMAVLGMAAARVQAQGATADQYFAAGNQTAAAKDYNKAIQFYQAALQLKPDHAGALQGLGNCQYALGQKAEALASYEKALAANPSNAALAQFVQALKGQLASSPAAVPATVVGGADPLQQGKDLFAQKKYAEAIPLFQQASAKNPADGTLDYYLGYAYAMTGDARNAALAFYRSDKKNPNPSIKAYADKVKASLAPADQSWVDAQLASSAAGPTTSPQAGAAPVMAAGKTKKAPGAKASKLGFRLIPGFAMADLKDFKTDVATRQAVIVAVQNSTDPLVQDPSASFDGKVPTGFLQYGLEMDYNLSPKLQLGLSYGMVPAGKVTSSSTINYPAVVTDSSEVKVSGSDIGFGFRYRMGQGKMRPFLGVRAAYIPVKLNWSETITQGGSPLPLAGDFKATAMGVQLQLGLDYAMGKSFCLSPFVGYRMAKATGFKGTGGVTGVGSTSGKAVMIDTADGSRIAFAADDPAIAANIAALMNLAYPYTGQRDLAVDLGGIQGGLMFTLAL